MRINIGDVALAAGVSVPTVSRVLNKNKYVSPELEKKVLKAVKDLNYIPNDNARGLASIKVRAIGLIVPFLNESISRFINACSHTLDKSGYDLMIGKTGNDSVIEKELLELQLSLLVSGMIIISPLRSKNLFKKQDIPTVFAYHEYKNSHSLIFDNINASSSLITSIRDFKKKRINILSGPLNLWTNQQRIEGCKAIMKDEVLLLECNGTIDGGYEKSKELFEHNRPDVLVCLNDLMAIGALRAAHEKGITVPENIEITGFEGTSYAQVATPTLTTVHFDDYLMGTKCSEAIIRLIEGDEVQKKEVLGFQIIEADSCLLTRKEEHSGKY